MSGEKDDQKAYRDAEVVKAYDRERKRVLAEREAARNDPRQIEMGGLNPELRAQLEQGAGVFEDYEAAVWNPTLEIWERRTVPNSVPETSQEQARTPSNAPLKKKRGFPWINEGVSRAEWMKRKEKR